MWCCPCGGHWVPPFRLVASAGGWHTAATGFSPQFPAGQVFASLSLVVVGHFSISALLQTWVTTAGNLFASIGEQSQFTNI